jgi:hypothetical protein
MEDDAVLLVQAAHEVAELGTEDALHRSLVRRDDVHLETARAQRGGHFEADEARAEDDGTARRRGASDDRATVAQGSQRVHVRQLEAGQRQPDGLGPRGQQQPLVRHAAAVVERHLARRDVDAATLAPRRSSMPCST